MNFWKITPAKIKRAAVYAAFFHCVMPRLGLEKIMYMG
jgi:hypothetical protein